MSSIDSNLIIENRTILEAVHNLQQRGLLAYSSFSDGWIIRLEHAGTTRFIHGYTFGLNTQASASIANDKVATYQLLASHNIPAVRHTLLTSAFAPMPDPAALQDLFANSQQVIKPTYGSRGRDVTKCDDPAQATGLIQLHPSVPSWSASPFIDIQNELRLVALDNSIGLAYEKLNPPVINGLKMFNLNLGATASRLDPHAIDHAIREMALDAMRAIGLTLGAVDIVIDDQNNPLILEINSGFSIDHYANLAPSNRQEVVAFYEAVILSSFSE